MNDVIDKLRIETICSTLTYREVQVINLRVFEEMTLDQVGKVFGVSRERIRQIMGKALRKILNQLKLIGINSIEDWMLCKEIPKLTKVKFVVDGDGKRLPEKAFDAFARRSKANTFVNGVEYIQIGSFGSSEYNFYIPGLNHRGFVMKNKSVKGDCSWRLQKNFPKSIRYSSRHEAVKHSIVSKLLKMEK